MCEREKKRDREKERKKERKREREGKEETYKKKEMRDRKRGVGESFWLPYFINPKGILQNMIVYVR